MRRLQRNGMRTTEETSFGLPCHAEISREIPSRPALCRVKVAKQRAAERAKERAEWEALQTQEAAAEAARLRTEREAKRATFEAAEAKLQQELAERAAVERRLLAEKEARLREEREREARCGTCSHHGQTYTA